MLRAALNRSASACVNAPPVRRRQRSPPTGAPRVGPDVPRPRANSGSGFITIPGPPPNGTSSTTRCRSVVKSRRSCTWTSSSPRPIARPTIAFRERRLDHLREDRDDVDLHRAPRLPCPCALAAAARDRFSSSNPSGGSTTIRRAAGSTPTQIAVGQRHQHLAARPSTTSRLRSSVPVDARSPRRSRRPRRVRTSQPTRSCW